MRRALRAAMLAPAWVLAIAACVQAAGLCPAPPAPPGAPLVFQSPLAARLDGAPNAHHWAKPDLSADPGLVHICYAVNVLAREGNRLRNLYPEETLPDKAVRDRCKRDYLALRQAGFPDCVSGRCLRVFGIAASPRSCRYPIEGLEPGIRGDCGVPLLQLDQRGEPTGFYVSPTAWSQGPLERPGSQLDARFVPYIVLPPEEAAKQGAALGDLALVTWRGRASFAVYGQVGPRGAASVATLLRLRGAERRDNPQQRATGLGIGPEEPPATTILLPGTCAAFGESFPRTAEAVAAAGQKAVGRFGGIETLLEQAGIEGVVVLSVR